MKKLFLHIGLAKTGSSALQTWLSLNAKALLSQGIEYADTAPEAKRGNITSGNGFHLFRALQKKEFDEAGHLLRFVLSTRNGGSFIVSCEQFSGLPEPSIEKLKDILDRQSIEVTIVAYVRSFYEAAYSSYCQNVKRGGATRSFSGSDFTEINTRRTIFLKRFQRQFGDNLVLINYDDPQTDIYAAFANAVGIDLSGTEKYRSRVNRSLAFDEIELLRQLNGLHAGLFSTPISDHLIALEPNRKTDVYYEKALIEKAREESAESIQWIMQQFNLDPPLTADKYKGQSSDGPVSPGRSSYRSIVDWALQYKPRHNLRLEFLQFLSDFATFLDNSHPDMSRELRARAKKYNRKGPVIDRIKHLIKTTLN